MEWPYTVRHHSPAAREILRRAGLSQASELDADEAERLHSLTQYSEGELADVTAHRLRHFILPSLSVSSQDPGDGDEAASIETPNKENDIMAKTATKSKKSAPTKAQVTRVAKMRRDGATWDEVIADTGIRTNSTGFRELLEEHGFDKFGRKDGKGTSKAKGWNSADIDGVGATNGKPASKGKAKAKGKRRVKRTKATANK